MHHNNGISNTSVLISQKNISQVKLKIMEQFTQIIIIASIITYSVVVYCLVIG